MTPIQVAGRRDIDDFFKLSGILDYSKLTHTPFLAFVTVDEQTIVRIIDSPSALLELPDDTPVMCQWRGEWRSDFFQFTVGQMRLYAEARNEPLKSAHNVVKRIGPQGGFRYLSYDYTDERGIRNHTTVGAKADAERLEAFFRKHNIPIKYETA